MATPLGASVPFSFSPLGRSPAVDLLRDTGRKSRLQILSLGRADLASLFYTFANMPENGELIAVLAHAERGIIARNVLLMVAITHPLGNDSFWSWRIYHNVFVSRRDIKTLKKHLEHLLSITQTRDSWASAPSSKFLKFANPSTLEQLHQVFEGWLQFVNTELDQASEAVDPHKERLRFMEAMNQKRQARAGKVVHCPGVDAAGAHFLDATASFTKANKRYLKVGALDVDGNMADLEQSPLKNPLMLLSCSYDEQYLDTTTSPLNSFHLAEAFDLTGDPGVAKLLDIAQDQFILWSHAFASAVRPEEQNAVVIIHHGDELSLCYRLQSDMSLPLHSGPQALEEVRLDTSGNARFLPLNFEVIDASDLPESRGLLATIVAARPLLKNTPHSVLYTGIKTQCYLDPLPDLKRMLCDDLTLLFTFLGIAPVGFLLKHTTTTQGHDAWFGKRPCKEDIFIPWKLALSGDASIDLSEEAKSVMYSPVITTEASVLANFILDVLLRTSSPEPGRPSYTTLPTAAMLLRYLKARVNLAGWSAVIEQLLRMAQDLGAASIVAEFKAWLALAGVDDTESQDQQLSAAFFTLEIPKSSLPTFIASRDMKHNLLQLCVFILGPTGELEATFSNVLVTWKDHPHNDENQGSLVVSFAAPKGMADSHKGQGEVLVALKNTTETKQHFESKLGPNLTIFTTDMRSLRESRRPYMFQDREPGATPPLSLEKHESNVWMLVEPTPGESTRRAKKVVALGPDTAQFSHDMDTPCRVDFHGKSPSNQKTRTSAMAPFSAVPDHADDRDPWFDEEDGRVHVDVTIRLTEKSMAMLKPFPIIRAMNDRFSWGMPSLRLDRLDVVKGGTASKSFVKRTLNTSLSPAETQRLQTLKKPLDELPDDEFVLRWKVTFDALVTRFIEGLSAGPSHARARRPSDRLFALANDASQLYALIIPVALRHDPTAASVVLDALVVVDLGGPRDPTRLERRGILAEDAVFTQSPKEMAYTKALLCASAERAARGVWDHRSDCELRKAPPGRLCGCGEGRTPLRLVEDERLELLLKRATRVAISPLFPVPFVSGVKLPQLAHRGLPE